MLYEFKNSLMKQLLCLISGNKKKEEVISRTSYYFQFNMAAPWT